MHNLIKRLFLLCLAKAVFSVADNVPCELGGKVVLKPDSGTNPPSSILWRLGQNKVADFDTDFGPDVTYYSDFNGRTTLNTTTGELTITGLRKTDEGVYSVEFNSKRLEKTYTLSVLKPVPKPAIIVSCNDNKTSCTLTCNGYTAGAEPVTYWWKVGEGNWENIGKLLTVDKSDSKLYQNGYKYTCKLKNPFSEEVSYSVKDVFGPVSSSTTRTVAVAVSIIVTIVLIGIGLTFVLVWKKKRDYPTDSVTEFLLKTLRQPCVFCHCTAKDVEGLNQPTGKDSEGANTPTAETPLTTKD